MPDLRPLFTERTAEVTRQGLLMIAAPSSPRLRLDSDTIQLLRDGLGRFDMEIRWLAQLDRSGVLGLWRSWTGHQIYEVTVTEGAQGHGVLDGLKVEQHPDRYQGKVGDEPDRFERTLVSVVNILRRFRAGYTPYGPAPDAGPKPPNWPDHLTPAQKHPASLRRQRQIRSPPAIFTNRQAIRTRVRHREEGGASTACYAMLWRWCELDQSC